MIYTLLLWPSMEGKNGGSTKLLITDFKFSQFCWLNIKNHYFKNSMCDSSPWVSNSLWKVRCVCLSVWPIAATTGLVLDFTDCWAELPESPHDWGKTFFSSTSCGVFSVGHRVSHQMVSTKCVGFALYMGAVPLLPLPWVLGSFWWSQSPTLMISASHIQDHQPWCHRGAGYLKAWNDTSD